MDAGEQEKNTLQTLLNSIGPGRFNPATGVHDDYYDKWEIGYFDHDPNGAKLLEPQLGVRVNGGIWILADALLTEIIKEQGEDNAA